MPLTPSTVQYHHEETKKMSKRESLKSPSLFLPEHISSRSCFCSTHVMERAWAVNIENREAPLTGPTSTFQPHYSRITCSPWMSCLSLHCLPAAEMHPLLENSLVLSPRKRLCLSLSCIFTGQSCYICIGGRGKEGQTGKSTEGTACHFTFLPCKHVQFKPRVIKKWDLEFTSFQCKSHISVSSF